MDGYNLIILPISASTASLMQERVTNRLSWKRDHERHGFPWDFMEAGMKRCSSSVLFILEQKWSVRIRWHAMLLHSAPRVWPLVWYLPAHVSGACSFLLHRAPGAVGNTEKKPWGSYVILMEQERASWSWGQNSDLGGHGGEGEDNELHKEQGMLDDKEPYWWPQRWGAEWSEIQRWQHLCSLCNPRVKPD